METPKSTSFPPLFFLRTYMFCPLLLPPRGMPLKRPPAVLLLDGAYKIPFFCFFSRLAVTSSRPVNALPQTEFARVLFCRGVGESDKVALLTPPTSVINVKTRPWKATGVIVRLILLATVSGYLRGEDLHCS